MAEIQLLKKICILLPFLMLSFHDVSFAAFDATIPGVNLSSSEPGGVSTSIKIMLLLTILSVAPSILLLMTSFTRIVIVLSFVRTSLGTQQMPPNQVIIGLSLFLTMFIMGPVFSDINKEAYQPFMDGKLTQEQALDTAAKPIKEFMAKHTREKDLNLFLDY